MNETMVTVVGHVANDPHLRATSSGAKVAGFRLASTERRFDKGLNAWRDYSTTFWSVSCWRGAAENVVDSLEKGQPVVVHGKMRDKSWEDKDGQARTSLEIDAVIVGHDLTRGVARFVKASGTGREETVEVGRPKSTDDWGLGAHPLSTGTGMADDAAGEGSPGREGAGGDIAASAAVDRGAA